MYAIAVYSISLYDSPNATGAVRELPTVLHSTVIIMPGQPDPQKTRIQGL